jgi:hypothetical protein
MRSFGTFVKFIPPLLSRGKPGLIFLRLRGGIGNQLFIYFGGLYIANSLGCRILFDTRGIDHEDSIKEMSLPGHFLSNKLVLKLIDFFFLNRSQILDYDVEGIEAIKNRSLPLISVRGFFQSKLYYETLLKSGIIFENIFTNRLDTAGLSLMENSVLIHIRGGDFLNMKNEIGSLGTNYYIEVKKIIDLKGFRQIYVTTDDEIYASQLLNNAGFQEFIFLQQKSLRSYECLNYFRYFKSIFLANSTFSWWGAQLAPSDSEIYAPNIWFRKNLEDVNPLLCEKWIVLQSIWSD